VLNLKPLVSGINGIIPNGISIKDFSVVTGTNQKTAEKILDELIQNNIGEKEEGKFFFNPGDKLKSALFALEKGALIDEIATQLNWKDFEGLVAEILKSKDFATIKNLILKNPRMEIDVVGIRLGIVLLIDCKHWKKQSTTALQRAVLKQIERTKHYITQAEGAIAVPAIVTLYQDKVDFINRVPIVPIFQFSSFVDEFYGNLDEMKTIKSY